MNDLTPKELRFLRTLNTPWKIQQFLDRIEYNHQTTAFSPRLVMRQQTAHCFEGAVFAAAALRANGYDPLILDLEAVKDMDHVISVFRQNGHWGAVAMSNYPNCRYRPPVYRTPRELAMSYFNDYFNDRRERTMRAFSRPVNLKRFDKLQWMTTEEPVWFIAEYLCEIPHTKVLTKKMEKALTRVDERTYFAGTYGRKPK